MLPREVKEARSSPLPKCVPNAAGMVFVAVWFVACWPISLETVEGLSDKTPAGGDGSGGAAGKAGSTSGAGTGGTPKGGNAGSGGDSGSGGAGGSGACIDPPETSDEFKRVFVTSEPSNANFGGVNGADARCQAFADKACLGGTWKAWLSDANSSPVKRFNRASVPYKLLDDGIVANNWDDIVDGTLKHSIDRTELGTWLSVEVWTGTLGDGTPASTHCANWASLIERGKIGYTRDSGTTWTFAGDEPCVRDDVHLYCFEQ